MPHAEVIEFYENQYDESARLFRARGSLEFARTTDILARLLPAGRLRILDIGGGAGVYAEWLAHQGHDVVLVDPVPRHIQSAGEIDPGEGSTIASLGDVRTLDAADDSFDVVLMLGPLYHLPDQTDRVAAWAQAKRVCRNNGLIVAAVISRFATVHDMLIRTKGVAPDMIESVTTDLETGQHRNPAMVDALFTTAYFHHPDEIATEARLAEVVVDKIIAVEGVVSYASDIQEQLADKARRAAVLSMLRRIEEEPCIVGASNHILAFGRA